MATGCRAGIRRPGSSPQRHAPRRPGLKTAAPSGPAAEPPSFPTSRDHSDEEISNQGTRFPP
ncbi:hypothetical protein D9599_17675 [Roseomonas sp. KE2513]|nr:hypothetical protein [Roseomonas sp. KE2513]